MATSTEPVAPVPVAERGVGRVVVNWITTTDHKKIGHLYLITSFMFFLFGGLLALAMRAELAGRVSRFFRTSSTTRHSPCTAR